MSACGVGKHPSTDVDGKPWPEGSEDALRAGQDLAGGWKCCFAGMKGDCKERVLQHNFAHNYRTTFVCDCCLAVQPFKRAPMPEHLNYCDFSASAGWTETELSHADYLAMHPEPSAWVAMP
eukprot:12369602-Alexandrium_andersonii.AAC.1